MDGLHHLGNALGNFAGSSVYALGVVALSVVFMWSGLAKLRDPWIAAMAMVDFGVIARPRVVLGRALAVGEFALGLTLAASLWAPGWAAAIIASVTALVLAIFTVLIARALRRGASFACYCFGHGDGDISRAALARTAALTALAAALAVGAADLGASFTGEERALGLVAGVAAVGTLVLITRAAPLYRLPAPPEGRAATLLGPAE